MRQVKMRQQLEQLTNTQKILIGILSIGLIAGGGFVLEKYFLPEQAQEVNEELPGEQKTLSQPQTESQDTEETRRKNEEESNPSNQNVKTLKSGTFTGKTGHTVKGTAKIVETEKEKYLRFEDYEQTQGPDVFVYLTPSTDPTTNQEINEGVKIRIDGGPDGGEITKEGNFNQKIPDDIDVDNYNGIGIWCDAFSTPFGTANLN